MLKIFLEMAKANINKDFVKCLAIELNQKLGLVIVQNDRIMFGSDDADDVTKMIKKVKGIDVNSKVLAPKEKATINGFLAVNESGKYTGFVVSVIAAKPIVLNGKTFEPGTMGVILNAAQTVDKKTGIAGTVAGKQTTPDALHLATGQKISSTQLLGLTLSAIESSTLDESIKLVMSLMIRDAAVTKKTGTMDTIDVGEDSIIYSDELKDAVTAISTGSLNIIGKDFGEVVGAQFLMKRYGGKSLIFPAASNEKLIDYSIDGYNISAKWQKGAAPSVNSILAKMDEVPNEFMENDDKKLRKLLESLLTNGPAGSSWFRGAEIMKTPLYQKVTGEFGTDFSSVKAGLNKKISAKWRSLETKPDGYSKFYKWLVTEYYSLTESSGTFRSAGRPGTPSEKNMMMLLSNGDEMWPAVISPMGYNLRDTLNKNKKMLAALTKVARMLNVKQIYMNMILKNKEMTFKILPFNKAEFEFHCAHSMNKPGNSKMSFKPSGVLTDDIDEE